MALTEKYKELIDLARENNVMVAETGNVLKLEGTVPTAAIKDKMWEIYQRLDPQFKSNDLLLNVKAAVTEGGKVRVVTQETSLTSARVPVPTNPLLAKLRKERSSP